MAREWAFDTWYCDDRMGEWVVGVEGVGGGGGDCVEVETCMARSLAKVREQFVNMSLFCH